MASRLRELILDQIEFHNLEMEDVLKKAKFPEHYFDAILTEQHEKLPAFPYMRTHLIDLANQLELESETVLSLYKKEFSEKISGENDKLPGNRFALPSGKKPVILASVGALVLVLGYLFITSSFFGRPSVEIVFPPKEPSPFTTTSNTITLSGTIGSRDSLKIDGQEVVVNNDGEFLVEYPLQPKLNSISFEAERFLGSATRIVRQVYYEVVEFTPETGALPVEFQGQTTTTTEVTPEPTSDTTTTQENEL